MLAVSLLMFVLDVLYGAVGSTFSLFVSALGGSAAIVGVLAGAGGLGQLLGAFPVGSFSDRVGRKAVFVAGTAVLCIACALFALAKGPLFLVAPQFAFGVATCATFPLGVAYISDTVSARWQTLAVSVYVSAAGLGFALGPLAGGWIAGSYGFRVTYRVASVVALVTAVAGWRMLRGVRRGASGARAGPMHGRKLLHGPILAASVAYLFIVLAFSGAVLPFMSLYAAHMGLSTFLIGALYATRATASVLGRVPAALAARRFSNAPLALGALALDGAAAGGISLAGSASLLFAAAFADGLAYGVFMTSGQCVVIEQAPADRRGAAIGAFSAAGAVGQILGGFVFGALASAVALRAVFVASGGLLFLSVPLTWWLGLGSSKVTYAAAGGFAAGGAEPL